MSTHAQSPATSANADRSPARRARLVGWCCMLAAGLLLCSTAAAATRTRVVAWGGDVSERRLDIPYSLNDAIALAPPYVLRANGDVLEMGTMPPVVRARNGRAIAATFNCLLVLRRNGTVVPVGTGGVCATPVPAGLANATAISIGSHFALALTSDRRVVAWGTSTSGTDVPPGLTNVIAIAAGRSHGLALRSTGEVVGWGSNADGELDFPPGLTDVVAIDAGGAYNLALKSDGSVLSWGDIFDSPRPVPLDLPPARALGAGEWRQAAVVLRDGTVREWGFQEGKALPPGLGNVASLAMGFTYNYALVSRPITPVEAIADMKVDIDGLLGILDEDRLALNHALDTALATATTDRALACTALRSFGERVAMPLVLSEDRRVYFLSQTSDVMRMLGCRGSL